MTITFKITNILYQYYQQIFFKNIFCEFWDEPCIMLQVKWWNTINEPISIILGYCAPLNMAPNILTPGYGQYLAMHTILLAHARAYRLYEKEFKETQQGE